MPGEGEKIMKKSVFAFACALLLAASVLLTAVPAGAEGAFCSALLYVSTGNSGRLHLREFASQSARSLGLYANGTQVRVILHLGAWAYVSVNGATGYMMTRYLNATAPRTAPNAYPSIRYVRTGNSGRLHLQEYASRNARSLGLYANGVQVAVFADYGAWSYVNVDGKGGYMMNAYLSSLRPVLSAPAPASTPRPAPYSVLTVRQPNDSFVYLRATRTSDSKANVICKVPSGSPVTLLEWDEWWSRVNYEGMEGYMVTRYLQQE